MSGSADAPDSIEPLARAWLALDVGGAHLKAAHSLAGPRTVPFEVWRRPGELGAAIAALASSFPPFDAVALTMTAELCDCFATKAEGVRAILNAVDRAAGPRPVLVWGTDGRFHRPERIRREPILAAAANWLALAAVAATSVPNERAILIDIGSTTTDLIPLDRGKVVARGRTDTQRLRTGELVYAGVRRTPVCALAAELSIGKSEPIGLAAELFATTLDVFLILGDLRPDEDDRATADGRPATAERARDRLARMLGADREEFSTEEARAFAEAVERVLLDRLIQAARRVCEATIGRPEAAVISGSGEFLARRVALVILGDDRPIHALADLWGEAASTAACAQALLLLGSGID
ncbi:MAG: hydantoinase/oxoprolinase family protein [Isosphaeraceae bacterium]